MKFHARVSVKGEVVIRSGKNVVKQNTISDVFKTYLINGFNGFIPSVTSYFVALAPIGGILPVQSISVSQVQLGLPSTQYFEVQFLQIQLSFQSQNAGSGEINSATLYIQTSTGTLEVAVAQLTSPIPVVGAVSVTWTLYFTLQESVALVGVSTAPVSPYYVIKYSQQIQQTSAQPQISNIAQIIATLTLPNPTQYGITPVTPSPPTYTTNITTSPVISNFLLTQNALTVNLQYVVQTQFNYINVSLICDGVTVLSAVTPNVGVSGENTLVTVELGVVIE